MEKITEVELEKIMYEARNEGGLMIKTFADILIEIFSKEERELLIKLLNDYENNRN